MRKYVKPELEMKKFVSNETIAAGTGLADFLSDNNLDPDTGITTYQANSQGTFDYISE